MFTVAMTEASSLQLVLSISAPLLSALLAGLFVHWLTRRRDRETAKRQQRVTYLLAAYQKLEVLAHRDLATHGRDLEQAYAEIVLFGDERHIQLAQQLAHELTSNGDASLDELLLALRSDLRVELGLRGSPLDTVPALRISTSGPAPGTLTHFESAWASSRRLVTESLASTSPQLRSMAPLGLPRASELVERAPGAAVATAYQEVNQVLRETIGDHVGDGALDTLALAQKAHTSGRISDASLTAIEGLGIMASLAHHGGSGTGLTPKRAEEYLTLASAVIYAVRIEAGTQKP